MVGLRYLTELTANGSYQLRNDMESYTGETIYCVNDNFKVLNASTNYTLVVGNYIDGRGSMFMGILLQSSDLSFAFLVSLVVFITVSVTSTGT